MLINIIVIETAQCHLTNVELDKKNVLKNKMKTIETAQFI